MADEAGSDLVPSIVQGVCPEGWHLPSHSEWNILVGYLGWTEEAGGKLKETETEHWSAPNTGATNEFGFTALPGGLLTETGAFANYSVNGFWYSASDYTADRAWGVLLSNNNKELGFNGLTKDYAFYVRCVKD